MAALLVVEDERHIASGLRFNLEAEGHVVQVVDNGESALELIASAPGAIDLVVLDVMLPGDDGLTLLRRLRDAGDALPVVMLTARGDGVDRIIGLEQGADVVVLIHPDYQYDATRIPALVAPIVEGQADLVLGSRFLGDPLAAELADDELEATSGPLLEPDLEHAGDAGVGEPRGRQIERDPQRPCGHGQLRVCPVPTTTYFVVVRSSSPLKRGPGELLPVGPWVRNPRPGVRNVPSPIPNAIIA